MLRTQNSTVARSAMQSRLRFGYALDSPCDVYELVSKIGVSLRFTGTSSLDGFYLNDGALGEINVSALRPAGHQRFTAAHELGHHTFGHGGRVDGTIDQMKSNSVEETIAETFARHLLMPKRAVQNGFAKIGTTAHEADPIEVFSVASWLGVGYTTLIQQMRWTLGIISTSRHHELMKKQPQQIKRKLLPIINWTGRKELAPLGEWWDGARIHLQIGDVVTGVADPPPSLFLEQNGAFVAEGIGQAKISLGNDKSVHVSISKADYVGLYKYRYLKEPLDG